MSRHASPVPLRWLALLLFPALLIAGGCGRSPSKSDAEVGQISVTIEPDLVNYHSMALSWTTTFLDTLTLRYRLYIWDDETTPTEDVPSNGYFEISYLSAGEGRIIPVTGFQPSSKFYAWVVAFRENPTLTVIGESPRAEFSTCPSPYLSISRNPRRVSGHRATSLDGLLYVVWPDRVFERFDPATNAWTELAPVPHAHTGFGLAAHKGKLYVIGGENQSEVDVFDPAAGSWSSRAPVPSGISVRAAATLRDTIITFAATDQLDAARAWNEYPASRQVMAYIPETDTWFARADRPGTSTVMGPLVPFRDKLYLFGGYSAGTTSFNFIEASFVDSVYLFDPDANAWTGIDRIPDVRVGFHAAASQDRIYLMGGVLARRDTSAETWTVPPSIAYTGTTGEWRLKTLLGAPLDFGDAAATVPVGSTIYFVNGGQRWPGTTGSYIPENDACGIDIVAWQDTVPYGIPYTSATGKRAAASRFIMGKYRAR